MVATTSTTAGDTRSLGPLDPDPRHVAFAAAAPPSSKCQDRDYAVVKLFPSELRFVTGVARAYDDDFPPELSHLVLYHEWLCCLANAVGSLTLGTCGCRSSATTLRRR